MATSHQFKDEINDLTECAICTETFLQPKVIPCLHTFCLKCLETYCIGKKPGDSMECPLCRGKFPIPAGGVSKLRNNIYVEKLIEAHQHLKSKSPPQLELCGCRSGKVNSIYCRDCNVAACNKCKHQNHRSHNTTDIAVYVKQCHQQIYEDVKKVEAMMVNLNVHTKETDDNFSTLKNTFTKTKADIEARSAYLKRQIEEQTQLLLAELKQFESDELEKTEQLKKHRDDITEKCQNFLQFAECSKDDNCASSDLIQLSTDLHAYAEDLADQFKSFAEKRTDDSVNIYFEQSAEGGVVGKIQKHSSNNTRVPELNDRQNTIIEDVLLQPPPRMNSLETVTLSEPVTTSLEQEYSSRHSTEINGINFSKSWTASPDKDTEIGDVDVTGVVSIHKRLYVAIKDSNAIKVYDCTSLGYIESITVGPLKSPYDITGYGSLLYISEFEHAEIHKFRLAQRTSDTWSVDGAALNLSMTDQQNVLGSSSEEDANFIVVFSRYGQRLQRIDLDRDFRNLHHAICLSNGNLVVCHGDVGDDLRRVCLVDCDGRVIKSYFGGVNSTDVGHLSGPQRLASYTDGLILVFDFMNNNLQILNENFEFVGELVLKFSGLYIMWTISMNEQTGQLFTVGEVGEDDGDNFRINSFNVEYK